MITIKLFELKGYKMEKNNSDGLENKFVRSPKKSKKSLMCVVSIIIPQVFLLFFNAFILLLNIYFNLDLKNSILIFVVFAPFELIIYVAAMFTAHYFNRMHISECALKNAESDLENINAINVALIKKMVALDAKFKSFSEID